MRLLCAFAVVFLVAGCASKKTAAPQHVIVSSPADLKWQDGPKSLPPGAQMAVLAGDPTKPGVFTMRAKLPADYKIPPHWHPVSENVTVLTGTLYIGMGDTFDETNGKAIPAGGFFSMPPKHNHFAYTREPTEIQIHGYGPWGITYVNPADDPRKK